jgi:hypothetical protein
MCSLLNTTSNLAEYGRLPIAVDPSRSTRATAAASETDWAQSVAILLDGLTWRKLMGVEPTRDTNAALRF